VADQQAQYAVLSPVALGKRLKQLEQQMYDHARNLEFEEAAKVRDEWQKLLAVFLGIGE
jgi:Helicase subunit of the DNA excision repair complex